MRTTARVAVALLLLALGIATFAHRYAFKLSRPSFSLRFFTAELAAKDATADAAFGHFDTALVNRNAALYEEVLGRPMTANEARGFKAARLPSSPSKVVRREMRKDIVYLVTAGNAGEFFEFIGGRWVFTPEDLAANLRLLFRTFGL